MTHDAELILAAGALLAAGVAASVVAVRLRLPALILFLGVGMLIGTDGLGWIDFDDFGLARLIGTVALVLILFEGGLAMGWRRLRPVARPSLLLAVGGTIVTALITGLVASALFDVSLLEGLLIGAIVAPTDGAAMFPLLRGMALPARLSRTLEGEAGFNDPVAVLLVLAIIELIVHRGYGAGDVAVFAVREVGIGILVGLAVGAAAARLAARTRALPAGTPLVGSFAVAAVAYGLAATLGGSGFLAVYLAGLALGDSEWQEKPALLAFHAGLASVAELGMFLTLGLLVFPSQLGAVALRGLVLAAVTAIAARPLATWLTTRRRDFGARERAFLGWAGIRGAVPVILATLPVIRHVPGSLDFFNIVFFAVLVSAAIQGATAQPVAARLGLTSA